MEEYLEELMVECDLRRLSPGTTKGYYNNSCLFLNYLEKSEFLSDITPITSWLFYFTTADV